MRVRIKDGSVYAIADSDMMRNGDNQLMYTEMNILLAIKK
jgi:hypothetical protein